MATVTNTIDIVQDAIAPLFVESGFEKRKRWIYTIRLADEVLGWVGINRVTKHARPGETEVTSVVGVRHQLVEREVAELLGQKFHLYVPPTIATALGSLFPTPEHKTWLFSRSSASVAASEMVAAVHEYGCAFMKRMIALPELARALERGSRIGIEDVSMYRRPVVLSLMGETQRATDDLDRSLSGLRGDLAIAHFSRFAAAFRERILGRASSGTDLQS